MKVRGSQFLSVTSLPEPPAVGSASLLLETVGGVSRLPGVCDVYRQHHTYANGCLIGGEGPASWGPEVAVVCEID